MLTKIPSGLDEILQTYGDLNDPKFEQKHIVSFELPFPLYYERTPVKMARCHRLAVENLQKALTAIGDAGMANEIKEYNGIYARRSIRGFANHPSCHSWGIAIDLGASTHPLGQWKPWPELIIQAFSDAGFFWGGLFKSRRDCMHFQLATHY